MKLFNFIFVGLILIQFSLSAQSTGHVTLSIKLYPIQTIEMVPSDAQTLEITNQKGSDFSNQSSTSSEISTFSTSQYALKIDSVKGAAFQGLRPSSEETSQVNKSIDQIIEDERYNAETDVDDLQVVYSMHPI